MSLQNFVLTVQLPPNLKLLDGSELMKPITFEVLSPLNPFYSTPDMVKLEGGIFLRKVNDITIAAQIHWQSRNADALTFSGVPHVPKTTDIHSLGFVRYRLFVTARQQFVTYKTCHNLIQNVIDLSGKRGSKTLGNFSVEYRDMRTGESGLTTKLASLQKNMDDLQITLSSGGVIPPGGTNLPAIAAPMGRNLYEKQPGRRWTVTGVGANTESATGMQSDGNQHVPVKFMSRPYIFWYYSSFGNTVIPAGGLPSGSWDIW